MADKIEASMRMTEREPIITARSLLRELADKVTHPGFDLPLDDEAVGKLRDQVLLAAGRAGGESIRRSKQTVTP